MSLQVLEEEACLNDFINNCCKMHYELTIVRIRKLAYEYFKVLNLIYPTKRDKNQMTSLEWMRNYREQNLNLSL